jgi:hypothetical protein
MTADVDGGIITPPVVPYSEPPPPHCADYWAAFWADFDAREAQTTHGTQQVLVIGEIEARLPRRRERSFETQSRAELMGPAFHADHTFVAYTTTKPFLTTREATAYCGFKTPSALRKAKLEGRIAPAGRRGGTGTMMWSREALDRYLQGNSFATVPAGRARTPPEANGGTHEERTVGSEVEQLGESQAGATRRLSTKGGRVSGSRASHRSEDGIDAAGCPKPAGPGGTRGGASLVEDGARLDPQRRKPADDQGARALSDLRRFFAARKS